MNFKETKFAEEFVITKDNEKLGLNSYQAASDLGLSLSIYLSLSVSWSFRTKSYDWFLWLDDFIRWKTFGTRGVQIYYLAM